MTQAEADARALELYRTLELPDPERIGSRYPHQVSGGQLQRLMAAMALCSNPDRSRSGRGNTVVSNSCNSS